MSHETAIAPNVPKSNIWREAGVPIGDVSTLAGEVGGALAVESVSALASKLVSGAADATTSEGDIVRSVAEENTPVGSGQRETTGDCAVSGRHRSTASAQCLSHRPTSLARFLGYSRRGICGNGNSAWASVAARASLVSLSGATSGAVRRAGVDGAVWEEVSPSCRKYQQWRWHAPHLARATIANKGNASEAENHHRPCGRFGDVSVSSVPIT